MDWIYLAEHHVRDGAVVKTTVTYWITYKVDNLLTTISRRKIRCRGFDAYMRFTVLKVF